eukprot:PITA_36452
MVDEMESLHKIYAWDLVELSAGRKSNGRKWVFKKNTNAEGQVEKYKTQLVEKGYSQVPGIDFGDIFSPVAKDSKMVKLPIPVGVKLSAEQCPKTQEAEEDMSRVPYASAVSIGILMYAMDYTRPNIAHAVGVLSRFMSKTGKEHWTTVKRVFRYLRGTSDYGLCYQGRPGLDKVLDICGFVGADWDGDLDQRRSTSGYVFNLFGGAVSWMSKKQSVVALSTTEAEYMAATHASKEAVWLQRLCSSMGLVQGAIRIDSDSQSAIFLAKNPAYHSKTKHIDVQYHFVRDMIEDKKVSLVKVDTLKNTTDALTKSVSSKKLSWCREKMGISRLEK